MYKPITMATTIPRINRIFLFVNIAQRGSCFIDTKGIKEVVLSKYFFDHPEYSMIETYKNADELYRRTCSEKYSSIGNYIVVSC